MMKLRQRLFALACILATPSTHAVEKPGGNAPAEAKKPAETRMLTFETAAQIKAMPPCKARVEEHAPCYSVFRAADGKKFSIGSPSATQDVVQFLQTLKNGQIYKFPGVFLDYQKTAPTYDTGEQIKRMPPCEAAVEHIGVRDSRLITVDGKMFFIGSRAATQEVVQFVQTLKVGETYKFPSVFLDYQAKQ